MYDQDIVFIVHKYISSQELQSIRTQGSLCKVTHSYVDWKQSPPVPSGVQRYRRKFYLVPSLVFIISDRNFCFLRDTS